MRRFQCVLIFSLALSPCFSHAENAVTLTEALEAIYVQNMLDDIYVLSSSQFEGRQAGTNGGKRSANFVAKRMERLGLIPTGSKTAQEGIAWYQQQSVSATQFIQSPVLQFSVLSPKEQHQVSLNPTFGPDFLPILDSPSVNIMAPVVFVGYGIDDPARGVNDYAGIDVDNRIVMFLRGKPTTYTQWVTHEQKVKTAHQKGALAFMVLTGPVLDRYEARRGIGQAPLAIYSSPPDERPLTGIWLSGEMGNSLFKSGGLSLQDLQTQLNEKGSNRSQGLGMIASLKWESTNEPGTLINVMGAIPGIDSILREEAVIVGAHRDHFGKQGGLLFSGADDNASGTALLLEVTRIMSQIKPQPKRTIVFASFDGEERGLIGSKMHVKNPGYPLNKTVAMINVDHVGVGNGKLTVGLTRLPKSIGQQAATLANLEEKTDFYGYFPGGDHVPFFEAGVPTVTVVSSGKHTSFHQPSDTPEKIQPEILQYATRYVLALIWLLSDK